MGNSVLSVESCLVHSEKREQSRSTLARRGLGDLAQATFRPALAAVAWIQVVIALHAMRNAQGRATRWRTPLQALLLSATASDGAGG